MTKDEYLSELRAGLAAFSKDEVDRAVSFYEEMVDDRVEAGVSEEEAVGSLEPPAEAAARIISEMPAVPRAAARLRSPKTPRSWFVAFIVAAVIGSPVWIPLTLGVIMAVIGCFIGLFGLLVAVWAIAASMLLGAPIGLLYLVAGVKAGSVAGALMGLGCGVAVAGVGGVRHPSGRCRFEAAGQGNRLVRSRRRVPLRSLRGAPVGVGFHASHLESRAPRGGCHDRCGARAGPCRLELHGVRLGVSLV